MGLKVLTVLHGEAVNYLDPHNATRHLHLLSCSPSGYTVCVCVGGPGKPYRYQFCPCRDIICPHEEKSLQYIHKKIILKCKEGLGNGIYSMYIKTL